MEIIKKFLIKKLIPESFLLEYSHQLADRFVQKYKEGNTVETTGEYDDLQDKLYWNLRRTFHIDLIVKK